jgi:predicted kinase
MKSTLVIVSGFSCTGKTALAKKIGHHFSLPVFGRDDLKESLFDSLGYSHREWSKKLGIASYSLLYLVAGKLLATGHSLVIESNFTREPDTKKLRHLKEIYHCQIIQVHCYTQPTLALARFKQRAESGQRHPGHVDHLIYEVMERNFKRGNYEIFDICNSTIKVNTTNFKDINYELIFTEIQSYLSTDSL